MCWKLVRIFCVVGGTLSRLCFEYVGRIRLSLSGALRLDSGNKTFQVLPFFFFLAEDGILDPLVTGVQTCALPIYVLSVLDRAEYLVAVQKQLAPVGVGED